MIWLSAELMLSREVGMTSQSFDAARDAVTRIVRDHWKLFLIEGIILVILGLLAVAVPVVAGLAVTILFGCS